MMTARKDVLSGTADEIADKLEKLSRGMPLHEYMAGTQLRSLAAELAKNPDVQVSVVRYENESQELEVRLADTPGCDPVMIDRNSSGNQCQVTCDHWVNIGTGPDVERAAKLIGTLLRICVDSGREVGD